MTSIRLLKYSEREVELLSIKTFTLRLTEEQLAYVGKKSEEIGVSKNDYIRRLIDGDIRADRQDKILQEIIEIKENMKGEHGMKLRINFPEGNRPEDVQPSWTTESNNVVSEVKWKGRFANEWLLKIQKEEDCLILTINEEFLEQQN